MNQDQKTLMIAGAVLIILSAVYLASAQVPQTPTAAMLFPLSILGLFFGVVFLIWSAAWIGLEKTNLI